MTTWDQAEDSARPVLRCPLCEGTVFTREQGRLDSRWGMSSHRLVLMICQTCGFVLQFSAGRGWWDFD